MKQRLRQKPVQRRRQMKQKLRLRLDATPQTKESAPALVLPQALEGMAGQTLETIVLPDGWVWASPDTVLSEGCSTEYAARFMVDDRTYDYTADAGYNADGHYVEAVLTISFTKVDDMRETMESGVMFLSNTLDIEIASQFPDTEFQKIYY